MKYQQPIEFEIHEKVKIIELDKIATIVSIWITTHGIKYEVSYFNNGERKECYMLENDIARIPPKDKIGIKE